MLTIEHDELARRLSTAVEGYQALLEYELVAKVMRITHTLVPPPISGRGVAAELMRAALELALDKSWSVVPVCSYAVAYMARTASPGVNASN